jgi:hypothetical protein
LPLLDTIPPLPGPRGAEYYMLSVLRPKYCD